MVFATLTKHGEPELWPSLPKNTHQQLKTKVHKPSAPEIKSLAKLSLESGQLSNDAVSIHTTLV